MATQALTAGRKGSRRKFIEAFQLTDDSGTNDGVKMKDHVVDLTPENQGKQEDYEVQISESFSPQRGFSIISEKGLESRNRQGRKDYEFVKNLNAKNSVSA